MGRLYQYRHLFLGLFIAMLFFTNLGSYGLLEDNEARFFEIAWEMEESGDLLTPRLNFINHFHKPPATFWLVGLSLKCLGPSEGAGRLPVVLAALATVALTALFLPSKQRPFTILVLSCNLQFWLLSRTVLTDMFLTLSVTACLLAAFKLSQEPLRWARWMFWSSLGFSVLVKGPVGPAIVGLTLMAYHLTTRKLIWRNWQPAKGSLIFSAVSLPWFLWACSHYPGLFSYLAGYQTLERVGTTVHGREGPIWFFLPVVLIGFLPWSLLLPGCIARAYKRSEPLDRFLLCWLTPSFLLFSLSGSKLPTYILPLFPALALLVASQVKQPSFAKTGVRVLVAVLVVLGMGSLAFIWTGLTPETVAAKSVILLSSVVCLTGALSDLVLLKMKKAKYALCLSAFTFGTFMVVLSFGFPLTERAYSSRHLGDFLANRLTSKTVVAEYADHLHGLPYYLGRRMIQISYPRETQFETDEEARDFLFPTLEEFLSNQPTDAPILLIVRRSDYSEAKFPDWQQVYSGKWLVLERRPSPTDKKQSP